MSKHTSSKSDETAAASKHFGPALVEREAVKEHVGQNPFAVFTEWTEDADEKAYADL
jgi:hypothetical protein